MIEIYRVFDDNGNVIDVLEPSRNRCCAFYTGDYCGGCDSCLFAQLHHVGARLERVVPLFGETESDVRGRLVAESHTGAVKRSGR